MIEQIQRVITNIVERVGTQGAAKESLGTVPASYPMMLSWIIVALFLLASGSFLWTGCNFQRSPAFERYLRSFDPGRIHIGTCVIIGVEQLPVLPEDVFDDAIRIIEAAKKYSDFLTKI